MFDNNYRAAGSRFVGTVTALGTTYASPYVTKIPGMSYDVGALASRAAWSLGEHASLRMEQWMSKQGLMLYAGPPEISSFGKVGGVSGQTSIISNFDNVQSVRASDPVSNVTRNIGEANAAKYAQLKAEYASMDPDYVPVSGAGTVTINGYRPVVGKEAEFMRQLHGDQEAGLNNLTAGEIKSNIEAYMASNGRPPDAAGAIGMHRTANPIADDIFVQEYLAENPSARFAVTHGPDMILGGYADSITGYGDLSVNSSIGSYNKYVSPQIYKAVSSVPPNSYITFILGLKP